MRAGLHTASFRVDRLTEGEAIVGVVQAGKVDTTAPLDEFDALAGSVFNDSTPSWGWKASAHHFAEVGTHQMGLPKWAHTESHAQTSYRSHDVVSLRLDLDEGTLAAYKGGQRLGVIASGMKGSFCWCVQLFYREDSITIVEAAVAAPAGVSNCPEHSTSISHESRREQV